MKKTLIALVALAGGAMAVETVDLTKYDVKFNGGSSLTSGNQLMTWDDAGNTYTNWYMEFSLEGIVSDGYTTTLEWQDTICTGDAASRGGLSVLVMHVEIEEGSPRVWTLSIGKGNRTHVDDTVTMTFDPANGGASALTFAVYNDVAYVGNKTTGDYISVDISSVTFTNDDATMTSGAARAFANSGKTPISHTTIASLDNLNIPDGEVLDMAKLVTTGVAVTKPVPEPTTATLSLLALAGLAARRRRR